MPSEPWGETQPPPVAEVKSQAALHKPKSSLPPVWAKYGRQLLAVPPSWAGAQAGLAGVPALQMGRHTPSLQ